MQQTLLFSILVLGAELIVVVRSNHVVVGVGNHTSNKTDLEVGNNEVTFTTNDPTTMHETTTESPATMETTPEPTTEYSTTIETTPEPTTEDPTTIETTPEPTTEYSTTMETTQEPTTTEFPTTMETTQEPRTTEIPTTESTLWPWPTTNPPDWCNHDCEYRGIDCHTYYTCVNYTYKEYHVCLEEDGLAFNPLLKVCDLIENVDRCRPLPTTPPPEDCICEYRPHEMDCRKYYYCPDTCQQNLCEVRTCPFGLLWSIDAYSDGSGHQQCTLAEKATCSTDPSIEFSCSKKQDGLYRNTKNCHTFWKCVDGKPLLYDCPKGLIYNPIRMICDLPAKTMMFCINSEI